MPLDWQADCLCFLFTLFEDWQEDSDKLIELTFFAALDVKKILIEHD